MPLVYFGGKVQWTCNTFKVENGMSDIGLLMEIYILDISHFVQIVLFYNGNVV